MKEGKIESEKEGEIESEKEEERLREIKREKEGEREKEREICRIWYGCFILILKGMTGALTLFSYLVHNNYDYAK